MVCATEVETEAAAELAQPVVEADLVETHRPEPLDEVCAGGGQRARQPGQRPVQPIGGVGLVAGEDLVGAVAGEADLDFLVGEARQVVERDHGPVGERLAGGADDLRQQAGHVGGDDPVAVLDAQMPGDAPRFWQLAEAAFAKADREGQVLPRRSAAGHALDDDGGVHTARKKGPQGHVADQPQADRVVEQPVQLLGGLALVGEAAPAPEGSGEIPVGHQLRCSLPLPVQQSSGRQPLDSGQDRLRATGVVESQELADGLRLDGA